jgi:hypothetical protein
MIAEGILDYRYVIVSFAQAGQNYRAQIDLQLGEFSKLFKVPNPAYMLRTEDKDKVNIKELQNLWNNERDLRTLPKSDFARSQAKRTRLVRFFLDSSSDLGNLTKDLNLDDMKVKDWKITKRYLGGWKVFYKPTNQGARLGDFLYAMDTGKVVARLQSSPEEKAMRKYMSERQNQYLAASHHVPMERQKSDDQSFQP